jgi:uncharacterized RDD family membrane protein YckC
MQTPAPGEPTQPPAAPPPPPSAPPPGYGQPPEGAPPSYPAAEYGSQPGWVAPQPGPAPGMVYAGFWIRFLALIIDGIPLYGILILGNRLFVTAVNNGDGTTTVIQGGWWLPLWLILSYLYYPVTWAALGETVGHRILGMEIRRVEDGQRPGVGQVIVRFLGYILCYITILIGFIIAAFDARKQGLHDKIAGTVVVRKAT